ncbi:MAG TPA: hypothetical protein PLJ23_06425 [Gemmatimonadales bacterium]|jgi:hypothetical protein|nr:hypothetical protein [Gemmatimonadales bacterium]
MRTRLAALFLTILSACATAEPDDVAMLGGGGELTTRDSAGVRIVEHPSDWPAHVPLLALADVPVTEIRDSVTVFDLILPDPVLLLADGRVVVFSEQSVVIHGADGQELERIGRQGEGPGEFRGGRLARGLGDTVLVQDNASGRLSFVVPGRGVVRTRPLRLATATGQFVLIGQSGNDALLLQTTGTRMPEGAREVPWYAARVDSGVDGIVVVDTVPGQLIVDRNANMPLRRYDFPPQVAAWHGALLTIGSGHSSIEVLRASGELTSSIRLRRPPVPIDQAMVAKDVDASVQWLRDNWSRVAHRGTPEPDWNAKRKELGTSVVGDTLWPFRKVLIGDDGTAWLKDGGYYHADTTWAWTGVARDGRLVGRLTGRGKDRIVAFGAGSALTREENADGVMVFRVHRLMPVEQQ